MTRTTDSRGRFRRPFSLLLRAALLLGLSGICTWHSPAVARAGDEPPGAYKAASPEPTPAETLILEFINRCRSNPVEDALRCVQSPGIPRKVDCEMFKQEMDEAKPAPPLVFDLALLKAARWHSYYQIKNDQVHEEEEGKEGYTARTPMPRAVLAGFKADIIGENIFRVATTPWYCHVAFVIDWGPGPGGMQPERGHRTNTLSPKFCAVGVGVIPWSSGERIAVTEDFGGGKQRMLGGVVFNDLHRNRFYDMGEGVGGVAISTGAAQTKSWKSGAYTVELPRSKARLTVELEGAKYVCSLPDGDENVKFNVVVSDLPLFKQGGKLLAAVKKIPETNKSGRFAALVDLCMATRDGLVEEGALEEITSLVEQVREDLEKDMAAVRQAVGDNASEKSPKEVQAVAKKYLHTKAKPWFADAMTCVEINAAYLRLKALHEGGTRIPAKRLDGVVKAQQKKLAKLTVPEWRKVAADMAEKTAALGGGSAAETKPGAL